MKLTRQNVLLAVALANALLWIIPSNVVELVARDHHTLLGRYSRTHFAWILGMIPISAITLYIGLAVRPAVRKIRSFRVLASLLIVAPVIVVGDWILRLERGDHYVGESLAYHRPPNQVFEESYHDRPEALRTYANAPEGFGRVECTLQTDRRGYRNRTDLEIYDAVVLGDSFAEGSGVTDGDSWPDKLSQASGLSVYNLGMSGYAPQHYLASLVEVGLALHPKTVFCLLYEGNDVRSARVTNRPESRADRLFKSSPLRQKLDDLIVDTFAPIGAQRELKELEMLSWLPVSLSAEGAGPHYAFAPKQLLSLYVDAETLVNGKRWKATTEILRDMNARCVAAGAELVLVYAPTKAHVVLPLVADQLPAEKVHAFAALRAKNPLPPPQRFLQTLPDKMDAYETIAQRWCDEEGIDFVSLTPPLRKAIATGRQIYYTYDQHWTPVGHEVVAQVVARYCMNRANDSGA